MTLGEKLANLKNLISDMNSVVIAYSGGTDSTFLAKVATDTLGKRALSVTAVSETYTPLEEEDAARQAAKLGLQHLVTRTSELSNPAFWSNPPERCYYCKKELMECLLKICHDKGFSFVIDGANLDDKDDFRPGHMALMELNIRSPLKEVGLTKEEIRALSKELGLPTWNKPAMACLASRIPYGTPITKKRLLRVAKSEEFLLSLGFSPVRVRDYGHTARIEVPWEQFSKLNTSIRDAIVKELKSFDYTYITLDLAGFRSGSMNEVLSEEQQQKWIKNT